jgi:hypothetical protein
MGEVCRLFLKAPSSKTAIIQQIHIFGAYIGCDLVERNQDQDTAMRTSTVRQAAILTVGVGTRLDELTVSTPKPLLYCGDRPFLAWVLRS